jgi:hypothetical protein
VAKIEIDFEWTRGFAYELALGPKRAQVIRQKGTRLERFWPLRTHESLYLLFAKLDGSPEECLQFASRWGLLGMNVIPGTEEEVDLWQHQIKFVRAWIQSLDAGHVGKPFVTKTGSLFRTRAKITSLDVLLSSGVPGARPAMVLQPRTLMDAMMLQLAQSAASGNEILACQQCGEWFEVGADTKRTVAKFCSDRCRFRFNYERRKQK